MISLWEMPQTQLSTGATAPLPTSYPKLPHSECPGLASVQDGDESYGGHADDDPQSDAIQEAIRNDELRRLEQKERSAAESAILLAVKIIAQRIHGRYEDAYDWCIEQVP